MTYVSMWCEVNRWLSDVEKANTLTTENYTVPEQVQKHLLIHLFGRNYIVDWSLFIGCISSKNKEFMGGSHRNSTKLSSFALFVIDRRIFPAIVAKCLCNSSLVYVGSEVIDQFMLKKIEDVFLYFLFLINSLMPV